MPPRSSALTCAPAKVGVNLLVSLTLKCGSSGPTHYVLSPPAHVTRSAAPKARLTNFRFRDLSRTRESFGGHSAMLGIHAGQGADEDLGARFVACFAQAADDVGLPDDPDFRAGLRAYMEWAVGEVLSYSPPEARVVPGLPVPRWGWNGLH